MNKEQKLNALNIIEDEAWDVLSEDRKYADHTETILSVISTCYHIRRQFREEDNDAEGDTT